jgi:hypothetical protein
MGSARPKGDFVFCMIVCLSVCGFVVLFGLQDCRGRGENNKREKVGRERVEETITKKKKTAIQECRKTLFFLCPPLLSSCVVTGLFSLLLSVFAVAFVLSVCSFCFIGLGRSDLHCPN